MNVVIMGIVAAVVTVVVVASPDPEGSTRAVTLILAYSRKSLIRMIADQAIPVRPWALPPSFTWIKQAISR